MNKYGIDNFSFEIIEECRKDELSEKERYWINYYNSTAPCGYNLTKGGDGGNTFQYRTEEEMEITREKIRSATSGSNNGFYGKNHSEQTKEYLRQINLGKVLSQETKYKLSESLKGHYMPQKAKDKISQATKRQWGNGNFKNFMTNLMKGNNFVKGNTWNKGRIHIYNPNTLENKSVYLSEFDDYEKIGFVKGINPNDKRHLPKIRHCSEDNLVGVSYDKNNQKWMSYITYQHKRYGTKLYKLKEQAIQHRVELETLFNEIKKYDIKKVDVQKSLEQNKIILYCD